ncbi:MAG: hypothetical protein NVSMB17_10190 [Candidatus Dormibacteria bacterium]
MEDVVGFGVAHQGGCPQGRDCRKDLPGGDMKDMGSGTDLSLIGGADGAFEVANLFC